MTVTGSKANGCAETVINKSDGSPTQQAGLIGHRRDYLMRHKGEKPLPMDQVPPDAQHVARGLERWLLKNRWARNIPEKGLMPRFHVCDESCKLHDHES